jgi:hypothetical protein
MSTDITAGLDFTDEGDDFLLSVTDEGGQTTKVRLTEQQVLTLSQSAPAWRDRLALRRSPEGGDSSAVVVTPVTGLFCQPDSLGRSVLVAFQSATELRMVYSLSPNGTRLLLREAAQALEQIAGAHPTRQ